MQRQKPFGRSNVGARQHRGVVQPGRPADATAVPQLIGVSCLGAAILYVSLVHMGGWRTGTIIGAVMLVGPLIEAVSPGFVGKLQGGVEQAQRAVHALGMVVLVAAAAVFAWLWVSKPQRHDTPAAPHSKLTAAPKGLERKGFDPELIERWRLEQERRRAYNSAPAGSPRHP